MPGTRYTSSFDSIERWQEASLPGNLPLNGSYKHNARSASTNSLDSSDIGAVTKRNHCGPGRYRKGSMEPPSESRRTGIKTPTMSHNPWQFVKVDPVPLYKKAVDQMKLSQEIKTVQDYKKEEEELWQKKLNSWKSRRKKVTEKTNQRVEDLKLLQQEENEIQRKSKTKTFSEIVENRAQKPRSYNLSIYGENDKRNRFSRVNSFEMNDGKHEDSIYAFVARRQSEPFVKINNIRNQDEANTNPQEFTLSHIQDKFEILEEDPSYNPKEDSAICMEEDCESCGRYTMDLSLESFNCNQLIAESRSTPSELSLDISEDYEKFVNDYEFTGNSSVKQGETGDPITFNNLNEHVQDIQQADNDVHLSMRLWLNSGTEDTDFGFKIREENGVYLVDELKYKGVGMKNGLKLNDRILSVNKENTSGRSRNSILFSMKQSVYNGYLDLVISRGPNEGGKENENSFCSSVSEEIFNASSVVNSENGMKNNYRNNENFGDTWKSNRLNCVFQSPQICKEPEPCAIKGNMIASVPSTVENPSSSFAIGEMDSGKKLEKTYSKHVYKFSSPTSDKGVSEEINLAEKEFDRHLHLDGTFDHTEKNVSPVSSASPSSLNKDRCVQLQYKCLFSTSDLDDIQQEETLKIPEREKLSQTPKSIDHVNVENDLMIIFQSHSAQNKNEHLNIGSPVKPVADKVLEKTSEEHHVPKTMQQFESHLKLSQDGNVNKKIPHEVSDIGTNTSENSDIDLSQGTESKLQTNREKVSGDFDYFYHDADKETLLSSEISPKQGSPSSEINCDIFKRHDFLDLETKDHQIDNDEKNLLTTDTRSLMTNNARSECVQYKTCHIDDKILLGEGLILKDEEKLLKEREESLLRRKTCEVR